jgi:TIR domain
MAHDVFIAHSYKDKVIGDTTCAWLERQGIRCWIAPRDIAAGVDWSTSIVEAVRASPIMVVIFSQHANTSSYLKREVNIALSARATIIPMRVEDVMPEGSLDFSLGTAHWLEAFNGPFEQHLVKLAKAIRDAMSLASERTASSAPLHAVPLPVPVISEAPLRVYDVFVSSKSEDYPHAIIAADYLRDHGLRIFLATQELPEMGNSAYFVAIDDALEASRHLLVVTSSAANLKSEWVAHEWQSFLAEKRSGRKTGNVVSLLCGQMTIGDLPYSLRQHEARHDNDLASLLKYFKAATTSRMR